MCTYKVTYSRRKKKESPLDFTPNLSATKLHLCISEGLNFLNSLGKRNQIFPFHNKKILYESLTLKALSLFFKILPISNVGDSIAYILATIHFLYPKLGSFSDMKYYFHQLAYRDSKVPKHFVGSNQMQCSPSFDWNWG